MGMRCSAAPGRHALLTVSITALHCMLSRYHPVKNTVLLSSCEASLSVTPPVPRGTVRLIGALYPLLGHLLVERTTATAASISPSGKPTHRTLILNSLPPLSATNDSIYRVSPCSQQTHRLSISGARSLCHTCDRGDRSPVWWGRPWYDGRRGRQRGGRIPQVERSTATDRR